MSGIYGYVTKGKTNIDMITPLRRWNDAYGEDKQGFVTLECAGFGSALFHIPAKVPMDEAVLTTEDGMYAVMDALIYNRDELTVLLGRDLSNMSDERVLLAVYCKCGIKGLREVNGDFAGAIYDGTKLILFRDHLGVRPLYWYQDGTRIVFATDMRGILAIPGADNSIDEEYLFAHLFDCCIDERDITDFKRIRILEAGSVLEVDAKRCVVLYKTLFWHIGEKKVRFRTEQEYIERMRELVYDSIYRRLSVVDKTAIGAELSGGLDSTVINAIIKELGVNPKCYSWSPPIDQTPLQDKDERIGILELCNKYGLECHFDYKEPPMDFERYIMDILSNHPIPDENSDDMRSAAEYLHNQNALVIFSGWGGDEGVSCRMNPMELWMKGEKLAYVKLMWKRCKGKGRIKKFIRRVWFNLGSEKRHFLHVWNEEDYVRQMGYECVNREFYGRIKKCINGIPNYFPFDSVRLIENGYNRSRLENAAAHVRKMRTQYVFPFLDYRVEEYAVSIPRHLYLSENQNRYIFRKAFREQMVDSVLGCTDKIDYGYQSFWENHLDSPDNRLKNLQLLIEKIDRNYWNNYFDVDKIVDNVIRGANDIVGFCFWTGFLFRCLSIQELIDKG